MLIKILGSFCCLLCIVASNLLWISGHRWELAVVIDLLILAICEVWTKFPHQMRSGSHSPYSIHEAVGIVISRPTFLNSLSCLYHRIWVMVWFFWMIARSMDIVCRSNNYKQCPTFLRIDLSLLRVNRSV